VAKQPASLDPLSLVSFPPELLGEWVVYLNPGQQRKLVVYRLVSQNQPITLEMMNEQGLSADERVLLDELRSLPEASQQRLTVTNFVNRMDASRLVITQQQMLLEIGDRVESVDWGVVWRDGDDLTVVTREQSGETFQSTLRLSPDGQLVLIGSAGEELVLVRP